MDTSHYEAPNLNISEPQSHYLLILRLRGLHLRDHSEFAHSNQARLHIALQWSHIECCSVLY